MYGAAGMKVITGRGVLVGQSLVQRLGSVAGALLLAAALQ